MMANDYFVGDMKADPQPKRSLIGIIYLVKAFKNSLLVRVIDADTKILNADCHLLLIRACAHNHPVGIGRVFDGIGQEVNQYLS